MKIKKNILFVLLLLYVGCDQQSNPFQPGNSSNHQLNVAMGGKARDFIIVKNINAENFSSNSFGFSNNILKPCANEVNVENCNARFWCQWDNTSCEVNPKDLLFVANELDGLLIYEIETNPQLSFNLIYSNNGFEYTDDPLENILDLELRSIAYSETNHTLYVLDKFEFIYQIFLPTILIDDENKQYCDDAGYNPIHDLVVGSLGSYHATKFILDENNNGINGLFIVNKHNANNELYLEESYSGIELGTFWASPSGTSCEGDGDAISFVSENLLSETDNIDYNVTDIAYDDGLFVIGNPKDDYSSFMTYDFNAFQLSNEQETTSPNKVISTLLVGDYLYTGIKGNGCYITLLPGDGILDENDNILSMPEDFSVYDIQYEKFDGQEFLLLSCGSNGVLIYHDENEDGLLLNEDFKGHIISSYAYVAKMFDSNTVLVGTRNGIEIYNIGE